MIIVIKKVRETGWKRMDWIDVARGRNKWWTFVSRVMHYEVCFWLTEGLLGILRTLLRVISKLNHQIFKRAYLSWYSSFR
jgi:hypothetical protein